MDNGMNRRTFIRNAMGTAALVAVGQMAINKAVFAADMPMVTEDDPMAVSLGFVSDATKADKTKYAKYEAGQHCGNCIFYTGAADAPNGPCSVYAGKLVPVGGWCSTWTKKA